MSRMIRTAVMLVLVAVLVAVAALPAQAARPPKAFFGVQPINTPSEAGYAALGKGNIGTFRTSFFWSEIEPAPGFFLWGTPDATVRIAAKNGLTIFPVLFGTPSWAGSQHDRPPMKAGKVSSVDYVKFVRKAVERYGPKGPGAKGAFWKENPDLVGAKYRPIRTWQVWNEPNLSQFWPCKQKGRFCRPVASQYATFATAASKVIKQVDRKAKVALAGLPETKSASPLIPYLTALYKARVGGKSFKNFFDAVAVHPYARDDRGVKAAVVAVRKVMSKGGDSRTPLFLTEIGWSTATKGNRVFSVGKAGQASRLTKSYRFLTSSLARGRYRVGMAVWFTVQDRSADSTYAQDAWQRQAGLFDVKGRAKPSWKALLKFTGGKYTANIGVGMVGQSPAPGPGGPGGDGGSGANPDGDPANGGGGTPVPAGGPDPSPTDPTPTPTPCMDPTGITCPK